MQGISAFFTERRIKHCQRHAGLSELEQKLQTAAGERAAAEEELQPLKAERDAIFEELRQRTAESEAAQQELEKQRVDARSSAESAAAEWKALEEKHAAGETQTNRFTAAQPCMHCEVQGL